GEFGKALQCEGVDNFGVVRRPFTRVRVHGLRLTDRVDEGAAALEYALVLGNPLLHERGIRLALGRERAQIFALVLDLEDLRVELQRRGLLWRGLDAERDPGI